MNVPPFSRLPLTLDVAPLLAEVAALGDVKWISHFNADYHDGGWQGVALRAINGDAHRLYPDPTQQENIRNTDLLARCPGIAAALQRVECPLRAVRILRLAAGSVIREHRDDDLCFEAGEARLHVPLVTNPDVEFYVDGTRVIMEPGECWYLNLSLPHRVQNRGSTERIHLVVDCQINDWLRAQLAAGSSPTRTARARSGQQGFNEFRELVLCNPELQETLRAENDPAAFAATTVKLGGTHGFSFCEEDVRSAMIRGRQAWLSQWVF